MNIDRYGISDETPLERQILYALKRALSEEEAETAEHLLTALEALSHTLESGSARRAAYQAIVDRTLQGEGDRVARNLGIPSPHDGDNEQEAGQKVIQPKASPATKR